MLSRADAVLTPVPGDVDAFEHEAVGTVRRSRRRGGGATSSGIVGRARRRIRRRYWGAATAESGADRWEFAVTPASVVAQDAAGATVGEFRPIRGLRGGGDLRWHDRRLTLDRPSFADHRFLLAEDDRELAVIVSGPRRMPMRVATSFDGTPARCGPVRRVRRPRRGRPRRRPPGRMRRTSRAPSPPVLVRAGSGSGPGAEGTDR